MGTKSKAIPTLGVLLALSMASSPVSSFAEASHSDSVTVQVDMGSGDDVSCVGESSTLTLPNNAEPQTLERDETTSSWSNDDVSIAAHEFESPVPFYVEFVASDCVDSASLGFLEVSRGPVEHMALNATEFVNAEEDIFLGPAGNENLGYADLIKYVNDNALYHGNLTPGGENFILDYSLADQPTYVEMFATMRLYGSNPTGIYRVEYLFQLNVGPGTEMLSDTRYLCYVQDNC